MAKKLVIDNGMKNDAIIEALEAKGIEVTAEPVIIDIVDTKNDKWALLFLMAEIKLKSSNNSLTKAQLRLKKFGDSSQMLRSMEAVPVEIAEEYEIGDVLEDMTFRIIDSIEAPYDGATPRQTKAGDLLVDEDGNEIYRQAVIIDTVELNGGVDEETGEEIVGIGHSIISCKPVTATKPTRSTRKRDVVTA